MLQTRETQPGQTAGLADSSSLLCSLDNRENAKKPGQTQAVCRDLLREDLTCNVSAMIATLEAALALRAADDDVGLIYSLRRARAYWIAISGSARDLASLNGSARS